MTETIDPRFEPVLALARRQVETGLRPSIQVAVDWCGRRVLDAAVGPGATPLSNYVLWSTTKPIVALALLSLLEERGIDVDERVARYIPEFGTLGKEKVTIAHLLSHRGGFPDSAPELRRRFQPHMRDFEAALDFVYGLEPLWEPGRERGYHPGTGWFVVGELVRRLDDRELGDSIRRRVLEPCGVSADAFSLGEPERLRSPALAVSTSGGRGAPAAEEAAWWNDPATRGAVIPGASGLSSAGQLVRIFRTLLDAGRGPGGQLLRPETIRLATFPHAVGSVDRTFAMDIPWGLGFHLKHVKPTLDDCGTRATPGTFGHGGHLLANTVWADPGKDLAACVLSNGLTPARAGISAVRALSDAIHAAVDTRAGF